MRCCFAPIAALVAFGSLGVLGACTFELGDVRSDGARGEPPVAASDASVATLEPAPSAPWVADAQARDAIESGTSDLPPACCTGEGRCATPKPIPVDGKPVVARACERRSVCGVDVYAAYFTLTPAIRWSVTAIVTGDVAVSDSSACG